MKITDAIRKLATDYPNAVYVPPSGEIGDGKCFYTRGDVSDGPERSGCIVGQAVVMARPELEDGLKEVDYASMGAEDLLRDLSLDLELEEEELHWINSVQEHQDMGDCWSEAVREADEEMDEEPEDDVY